MQYIIEVRPDQDLQALLAFLEKMQVAYRPVELPKEPNGEETAKADIVTAPVQKQLEEFQVKYSAKKQAPKKLPVAGTRSSKFRGKLSAQTAEALQKYVEESRNEWERIF